MSMAEARNPDHSTMILSRYSVFPPPPPPDHIEEVMRQFLNTAARQRDQEFVLKLVAASSYIPKDNPQKPRGEDAHFICADKQTIGVADGVGGWIKHGIDSGEYARQLMMNSILAVLHHGDFEINPKRVLQEAYNNTTAEGSSTACIITLSGNRLKAANVGDSGFVVMRKGSVIYTSPTQQRNFNCPYQLGNDKDDPTVAEEIELFVESGDVVVAGTDGLLDNMNVGEIEEVVRRGTTQGHGLDEICCYMANLALYNSFDKYADTPYSIAARKAGRDGCIGGKIDDITVIIARIETNVCKQTCVRN